MVGRLVGNHWYLIRLGNDYVFFSNVVLIRRSMMNDDLLRTAGQILRIC